MTPEQRIEQLESENQALQVKLNRANSQMVQLRHELAKFKAEQPKPPAPKKEKLSIDERMRRIRAAQNAGRG